MTPSPKQSDSQFVNKVGISKPSFTKLCAVLIPEFASPDNQKWAAQYIHNGEGSTLPMETVNHANDHSKGVFFVIYLAHLNSTMYILYMD